MSACVKMAYLPTDESVRYVPSAVVEVFWKEPDRPYKVIGRISATSDSRGEETLFRKVKDRAARAGANAIIMGGTDQTSSVIGTPVATGGTLIVPVTVRRLEALAIRWVDSGGG